MIPPSPLRLWAALFAVLLSLCATAAQALDRRVIPLSNLRDGPPEAVLNGETDSVALRVFIPPTGPLSSVLLTLSYENGIDILPEKGTLAVFINGAAVAELPLAAFKGPVNAAISLPASLMRPGENQIVFETNAQHRAICTVRGTFDLWARVNLAASSLTLEAEGTAPEPDLAMMRQLLVASDRTRDPLTILKAGADIDADHLGWGAIVAQSYGLLLGDQSPRIVARPIPLGKAGSAPPALDSLPGLSSKNILIGPRDQIAPLLGEARAAAITGPFLAVYPIPGPVPGPVPGVNAAPGAFLAVVSGRNPAEVDQAVARLSDVNRPLPTQSAVIVTDVGPSAAPPREVQEEGRYRLSDLGFSTVQHDGYRYTGHVALTLPTGYAPVSDRAVLFHVNGAFEGNLGPGAILNVRVNGRAASAMEIDKRSSGAIENGEMQLPMTLFRPGPNIIDIEAELPPASGADCVFAVRRPRFTLQDNSSLEIPGFARLVTLPNLATTAQTAYPYGGMAGRDPAPSFDLVVVGKEAPWFGAAWTMAARLAQRSGDLLRLVPAVGWDGAPNGNALIVGPVAALPQAAFASAPLPADRLAGLLEAGALIAQASARGEPMAAAERRALVDRLRGAWTGVGANGRAGVAARPAPVSAPVDSGGAQNRWQRMAGDGKSGASATSGWAPDWARRGMAMVARYVNHWTVVDTPVDVVALTENTETLPEAALLQYHAPGSEALTWTVLTASDTRSLDRALRSLGDGGLWDKLRGGGGLWSSVSPSMTVLEASRPYQIILNPFDIGNVILILARNLSQRLELLFGLLLGTAVVLTVSMRMLLRGGHAERNHKEQDGS